MGLSRLLLVIAVAVAVLPIVATRVRPPRSMREVEMSFVVATMTLAIGTFVVSRIHDLDMFLLVHLAYLLAVVTLPCLLIGWWVTWFVRRRRTVPIRLAVVVGVLLALIGVWGTHIEPNWLETDVVAITGPVGQPVRVGVLADVQTPNVGRHEWNAVNTLIEQEPDIVLIAGDLFQGPLDVILDARADFVELLRTLVSNVEVVAVVSGDSDDFGPLRAIVDDAGALYLDNRIATVEAAGQQIRLAGVAVLPSSERLDTLAALGEPSDRLSILLAHRPDAVFDLPLDADVDLVVSGHTHGGQVALPFLGPIVTFSDVPRSVAAGGLGDVEGHAMYVSTGVGLERRTAPQVRFGVRPSVGIIEVVPSA